MTAAEIIKSAAADGLTVGLSAAGKIKANGRRVAVNRWRPLLREHKVDIIRLLQGSALPPWCRANCPHLRRLELDNLSPVTACYRVESPTKWVWTRLDKLDGCPLTTRVAPAPPPPPPSPPPPTIAPEVPGLPCGGCGSTSYRRVVDGFIFPDGSRADGWHCGARECGIKLLVGRIRT